MTTKTILSDTELKEAVIAELDWLPYLNSAKIGVAVNDGAVMLSGEVDSYPEKIEAERAALRVRGVTAIAEELTVRGKWQGAGDVDIAREATDALVRAVNIPDGAVTATVHDHVITLSGHLPWQYQREAASRAVRYLKGVTDIHNNIAIKPVVSASGVLTAIGAALVRSAQLDGESVTVHVERDGSVRLEGTVRSWHERTAAQRAAWFAPGVSSVINNITIHN
jgi:osmotically-inducible protein OsmY